MIWICLAAGPIVLSLTPSLGGASEERVTKGTETIVATVGGEPVYANEVARLVKAATRGRKVDPAALPVLQAQSLAEIVDRRLVLAYARRTGAYPEPDAIKAAAAATGSKLAAEGRTLEDYLRDQLLTEAGFHRQLAWGLVWDKYLAKYATDARLSAHFNEHRRQFDGTELAVSHILLRPSPGPDRTKWEELTKQAAAIRASIAANEISFADAAKRHSAGPSGKEGGQLGFIPRRGVMDETFSRAAFTLEVGQVSPPIVTPFGVHLVRCDAIRPGRKGVADVRKQLEEALARELLDKIARLEEHHTAVQFSGNAPHFKPGARELIVP
jgi:parvulin-like peptidyl-prolyl isomerase